MLIMNQSHDAMIDTTGAVIRIDTIREEEHLYYRVCGYSHGMRVTLSEHEDIEWAKKVMQAINYAAGIGMDWLCIDKDLSVLDDAIEALRVSATKKTFDLLNGVR